MRPTHAHITKDRGEYRLGVTDKAVRDALLASISRIRSQWTRLEVVQALERGDVEAAVNAIRFDEGEAVLARLLPPPLRRQFDLGGKAAQKGLRASGIEFSFNLSNPRATSWATRRAADLITEFGRTSREGVRAIIVSAFEDQLTPQVTARLIRSSGVGLTDRLAQAVYRYRDRLIDRDDLDLSVSEVDRRTERYADRLLRYRSEMIARTEIAEAQVQGTIEGWRQAGEDGLIDVGVAYKTWVLTDDDLLCDLCLEMDGVEIPVNDLFNVPDVGQMAGPPAHPACRCDVALLPDGPRDHKKAAVR